MYTWKNDPNSYADTSNVTRQELGDTTLYTGYQVVNTGGDAHDVGVWLPFAEVTLTQGGWTDQWWAMRR
jgi:hypothetical protein